MGENNERRQSFSALNPPIILHRPSSATTMDSPDHPSGISTPPLQTSASVPFKWEQEPGKPIPGTQITARPEPARYLDPPPCRMQFIANMESATKITKTLSPSLILDVPYIVGRPRFSSFRFFIRDGQDSFESYSSASTTPPRESTSYVGALLGGRKSKGKGFFGKFKGGNREVDGGSFGFSSFSTSSCDSDESCRRLMENGGGRKMRRRASFSTLSHGRSSHIWATIYEGSKHVIHWKSSRKESKAHKEGQD